MKMITDKEKEIEELFSLFAQGKLDAPPILERFGIDEEILIEALKELDLFNSV